MKIGLLNAYSPEHLLKIPMIWRRGDLKVVLFLFKIHAWSWIDNCGKELRSLISLNVHIKRIGAVLQTQLNTLIHNSSRGLVASNRV